MSATRSLSRTKTSVAYVLKSSASGGRAAAGPGKISRRSEACVAGLSKPRGTARREGRGAQASPGQLLLLLLLLFLTFSVLVANPKKLLYTVANPARGLLNREKRTKEKVWQHTPPTPHTARWEKIKKITRRIYRRYAGGRSRVRTRIPSARRLGLWVWLRKILHSRLR